MTGLQTTGGGPGGYGPGGGAPPGGGGYGPPPGGGAPPGGGGYGPPPGGGGYGGPPPGGGGFGGPPPGGGGFGGPPQGGYGGPPPGGYGGPPMPPSPPQKKGPNVGLIVGLGCLGLVVLGGLGIGGIAFMSYRRAATAAAAITRPSTITPPPRSGTPSGGLGAGSGSLKAELRDLREFKGDFGKGRYFVGEIHNTGDTALGFPSAKITLLDASNTAVDSGTCASVIQSLPPGQKVPCTFSTFKAVTYATTKVDINPMRSYTTKALADLKVEGIKFTPKKGYSPHQLEGKITNRSSFKAKSVWALVSLYGADGKIVGAEQTLVAGSDLDGGQSGLFSAKVYNAAAAPQTYNVIAIGYGE